MVERYEQGYHRRALEWVPGGGCSVALAEGAVQELGSLVRGIPGNMGFGGREELGAGAEQEGEQIGFACFS